MCRLVCSHIREAVPADDQHRTSILRRPIIRLLRSWGANLATHNRLALLRRSCEYEARMQVPPAVAFIERKCRRVGDDHGEQRALARLRLKERGKQTRADAAAAKLSAYRELHQIPS